MAESPEGEMRAPRGSGRRGPSETRARWPRLLVRVGAGLLVLVAALAPFPTGSQDQAAWATAAAAGLVGSALCLLGASRRPRRMRAAGAHLALAGLLTLLVLQLAPLPSWLVRAISPSRAELARKVSAALGLDPPSWLALTVSFKATRDAFLLLAAYVLCFLAAALVFRRPAAIRRLYAAIAIGGTALAAWGLARLVGLDSLLNLDFERVGTFRFTSSYTSPNRFAFLMTICLFAAVGWRMLAGRASRRGQVCAATACAVVLALALVLTLSRLGIASATVAVLVLAFASARAAAPASGGLPARAERASPRFLIAGAALAACILAVSLASSVDPVWQRYSLLYEEELGGMGRLSCWRHALGIVRDYPLFGSGAGSFADVFPMYQGPDLLPGFWKYAHNDYLNTLTDLGPAGLALVAVAATAWLRSSWRGLGSPSSASRVAAWVGLGAATAAIVHSAADFVLKQPANALVFAALAGASVGPASSRRGPGARRLRGGALVGLSCAGLVLVPALGALVASAASAAAARLAESQEVRVRLYEKALAFDPSDAETRLAAAVQLAAASRNEGPAEALGLLRASRPGEPADARALYLAGVARWSLGDRDGADLAIATACELAPAYPSMNLSAGAYFLRRWVELRGGEPGLLELAGDCLRAGAVSSGSQAALADALDLAERVCGGGEILERVTPPDAGSRLVLARHHERAGRPREAASTLEGALASAAPALRVEILENLARLYDGLGETEKAVDAAVAFVAALPPERRPAAAAALVARACASRRPADGAIFLRALRRRLGAEAAVSLAEGEFARLGGELFAAYRAFAAYAQLSPADPEGRLRLAEAARRLGRANEAELHAAAAVRLSPADTRARLLLAELRAEAGAKDLAVEDMRLVLGSRPADIALRRHAGSLLRELGRLDELVALWREAVARDESNAAAHEELARAYVERGEFELAGAHAARALALDPRSVGARELVERYGLGEP